jgi:hypothetical protein
MAFNFKMPWRAEKPPEIVIAPQDQVENLPDQTQDQIHELIKLGSEKLKAGMETSVSHTSVPPANTQIVPPPATKSQLRREVEGIMEDGLGPIYQAMTPEKQVEFKLAGEVAAGKLAILLRQTKIKISQIFKVIFNWLKVIPGANKFFLEQEAKIKSDRLLFLKKRLDSEKRNQL